MLRVSHLSSSSITLDPVSNIHPSVLFPFFHVDDQDGHIVNKHESDSVPTVYSAREGPLLGEDQNEYESLMQMESHMNQTSTPSTSQCSCQPDYNRSSDHPSTITIPSLNPHQSVVIPMPVPAHLIESTCIESVHISSTSSIHTCYQCGRIVHFEPGHMVSSGTTQADTAVHTTRMVEKTLYSWTQLVLTSVLHCMSLLPHSNQTINHSVNESQRSIEIHSSIPRLCEVDKLGSCPGHVGTEVSYRMHVRQWQEPMLVHKETLHCRSSEQKNSATPQTPQRMSQFVSRSAIQRVNRSIDDAEDVLSDASYYSTESESDEP